MCGRFAYYSAAEAISALFGVENESVAVVPQYNIAPTDLAAVIRQDEENSRSVAMLRWGLLPPWAKDKRMAARMINARAETVAEKPAYRAAYKQRRCLVPADGYYEWTGVAGSKTPWYISRKDEQVIGLAGLWERWGDPETKESVETFTILTMESAGAIADVHHRMPVMLDECTAEPWLDTHVPNPSVLQEIDGEAWADQLRAWPVSKTVNSSRNEGPELIVAAGDEP